MRLGLVFRADANACAVGSRLAVPLVRRAPGGHAIAVHHGVFAGGFVGQRLGAALPPIRDGLKGVPLPRFAQRGGGWSSIPRGRKRGPRARDRRSAVGRPTARVRRWYRGCTRRQRSGLILYPNEPVENTASLLRIEEVFVNLARVGDGIPHGVA